VEFAFSIWSEQGSPGSPLSVGMQHFSKQHEPLRLQMVNLK